MSAQGFGLDALLGVLIDRLRRDVSEMVSEELRRAREDLAGADAGPFAGRETLSVAETAEALGVSVSMVRYWIRQAPQ